MFLTHKMNWKLCFSLLFSPNVIYCPSAAARLNNSLNNSYCFQKTPEKRGFVGFPGSSAWQRSCLQYRRPWFNSWVGRAAWRRERLPTPFLAFPGGAAGKESTWIAGDLGLIPGLEKSPGEGNGYPLQYSGLENPMGSLVHGVAKNQQGWATFSFMAELSISHKDNLSENHWTGQRMTGLWGGRFEGVTICSAFLEIRVSPWW